jgi:hypothetical protein
MTSTKSQRILVIDIETAPLEGRILSGLRSIFKVFKRSGAA